MQANAILCSDTETILFHVHLNFLIQLFHSEAGRNLPLMHQRDKFSTKNNKNMFEFSTFPGRTLNQTYVVCNSHSLGRHEFESTVQTSETYENRADHENFTC